jgi:hypothetical protein
VPGDCSNPPIHAEIGKLRYLADNTEPSILNAMSNLATGASNPSNHHTKGVRDVARYLQTHHNGTTYGGSEILLFAEVDANYITKHDSKSQIGYALFLNLHSGTIHARSRKDTKVSRSSTEPEIRAIGHVITEIVWARGFLTDITFPPPGPTTVYTDSYSSIIMGETQKIGDNSKHITHDVNYINQHIRDGTIILKPVDTEDNCADLLTKNLPSGPFAKHSHTLQQGHGGKPIVGTPRKSRNHAGKAVNRITSPQRQRVAHGN